MIKKILILSIFLLVFAIPTQKVRSGGLAAARSFWIGQFAHGPSGNDQFSTTLNFINLSTTTSTVTVRTFSDDGSPLDLLRSVTPPFDPVSERQVVLAGRGTGTVVSDGPPILQVGYAQAETVNAVGLEVIFDLREASGNLITATNVRVIPLVTALSFFGRSVAGVRTGMSVLLPPGSDGPTDVDLTLFNADGTIRGVDSLRLEVGQKTSRFLDELVENLGNFTGTVEARSDEPISLLPLRQEGVVLTTQDAFPPRQLN